MRPATPEFVPDDVQDSHPSRLWDWAAWVLAGTLFLIVTVTSNLTSIGLGANPFTYDDVALPRFAVALVGTALTWLLLSVIARRTGQFSFDTTWLVLLGLGNSPKIALIAIIIYLAFRFDLGGKSFLQKHINLLAHL